MIFETENKLKNRILLGGESSVRETKEKVFKLIYAVVSQYYEEFKPIYYERTYQFFTSLVDTNVRKEGNGFVAEVYFDLSSINYQEQKETRINPDDWSNEKIINEIMTGGSHGGYIAPNGNTKVWTESIEMLDADLIEILKHELIKNGIPVKTK